MAATAPWNKSSYTKDRMARTDPVKEASTFERMNGRLQLFFYTEWQNILKNGWLQVIFLKKVYFPWCFKWIILTVAFPKTYNALKEN